jgi:hypothetical protein
VSLLSRDHDLIVPMSGGVVPAFGAVAPKATESAGFSRGGLSRGSVSGILGVDCAAGLLLLREVLVMGRSFVWAVMGGVFCLSLSAACSDGSVVREPSSGGSGAAAAGPGSGGDGPAQGGANQGGSSGIPSGQGVGEACSDDL